MKKLVYIPLDLVLLGVVTSCTTVSQPEAFESPAIGGRIECREYEQAECGLTLRGCGPDRSIEFNCLTNVRYIGPGPAVPADFAPAAQEDLK